MSLSKVQNKNLRSIEKSVKGYEKRVMCDTSLLHLVVVGSTLTFDPYTWSNADDPEMYTSIIYIKFPSGNSSPSEQWLFLIQF